MNAAAAIRLVAVREVRERLRTRAYLISTGILILLLGIGMALPKVISAPTTTYRFGVVGSSPVGLTTALGARPRRMTHTSWFTTTRPGGLR